MCATVFEDEGCYINAKCYYNNTLCKSIDVPVFLELYSVKAQINYCPISGTINNLDQRFIQLQFKNDLKNLGIKYGSHLLSFSPSALLLYVIKHDGGINNCLAIIHKEF